MTDIVPGNLFIVAAPSGGGKTSLVSWLVKNLSNIVVSVSHTTRSMRPGETDREDYYFVSEPVFLRMIKEEAFIEHARVFSHWYGTSVAEIQQRLQNGIDVILDIDWQGAQQIKHRFKEAVGIFIIPPSLDALKERLQNRQQDDASVITHRMELARNEIGHYTEFDYLIVNDDFEEASKELQAIIIAQRLRIQQQLIAQRKLLSFLLSAQ